jgi:hypothetical protein
MIKSQKNEKEEETYRDARHGAGGHATPDSQTLPGRQLWNVHS